MAWRLDRDTVPKKAASALYPKTFVKSSASQADYVVQLTAATDRPFGAVDASAGQAGAVAVYEEESYVKAVAAASLGPGAAVAFASLGVATSAQGASALATIVQLGPAAAASGTAGWEVGISQSAAAVGEVFTVYLRFRQNGGLA